MLQMQSRTPSSCRNHAHGAETTVDGQCVVFLGSSSLTFLVLPEFYPEYAGLLAGVFGVLPLAEDASGFPAELIDRGNYYPGICNRSEHDLSHSALMKASVSVLLVIERQDPTLFSINRFEDWALAGLL